MRNIANSRPKAWERYLEGVSYNQRLTPSQYNLVETNTEFFVGNQWLHLPNTEAMRSLPKPTFNILKRVSSLFIASLTSSGITLRYEPLAYYDGTNIADPQHDASEFTNAAVSNLLEKLKFDFRIREALFDGAQTGDYCAHFYFDPNALPFGGAYGKYRGEIKMELVDGINVHFGNPNSHDVQSQPYIILVGRAPTISLQNEAIAYQMEHKSNSNRGDTPRISEEDIVSMIQPDSDYEYQTGVGGKTELPAGEDTGSSLYVIMYTKVTRMEVEKDASGEPMYDDKLDSDGNPEYEVDSRGKPILDSNGDQVPKRVKRKRLVTSVYVTKATQNCEIYSNVDTGLSLYPIAWGNWERQKNQYHGRALVTGLVPNQIFINTMFATAMRHMQLAAFPKTVYNADLISKWTNEVGQSIAVHGLQPGQSISQVAANLNPAEMSGQIFTLIDKAMEYTKECLGATDAQLGNVKPDNTSALMVLQTNAEVPLENVRAGVYEWTEDIGHILPDMMGTYYGVRPIVVEREFDEPVEGPDGAPMLDPMTGLMQIQKVKRTVKEEFDFSQLKHIALNLRVDAGATTYFSEIAMTQTLDNLRKDGTLDVIQYLERIPDKLIPRKEELVEEIRSRMATGSQANAAAGAAIPEPGSPISATGGDAGPVQGGPLSPDKAVQGLSMASELQMANDAIPNIAKKTALSQGAMRAE